MHVVVRAVPDVVVKRSQNAYPPTHPAHPPTRPDKQARNVVHVLNGGQVGLDDCAKKQTRGTNRLVFLVARVIHMHACMQQRRRWWWLIEDFHHHLLGVMYDS